MSDDPVSTNTSSSGSGRSDGGEDSADNTCATRSSKSPSNKSSSSSPSPALAAARQAVDDAEREREAAARQLEEISAMLDAAKARVAAADGRYRRCADALEDAELREPCQWNTMYGRLLEYKAEHGDCLVPHSTPGDKELTSLGRWVANQRVFYKMHRDGKTGHIKPARIKTLEKIGFVWNKNEMLWDRKFRELVEYRERHGTCDIPAKCDRQFRQLRKWCDKQRDNYRLLRAKRTTSLTPDRIEKLEGVGLGWRLGADGERDSKKRRNTIDPSKDEVAEWWDANFAELRAYREKHGHCRMHRRLPSSERATQGSSRLRDFASWQRKEYKRLKRGEPSEMTEERIRKLEEVGFEFVINPRRGPGKKGAKKQSGDDDTESEEDNELGDDPSDGDSGMMKPKDNVSLSEDADTSASPQSPKLQMV